MRRSWARIGRWETPLQRFEGGECLLVLQKGFRSTNGFGTISWFLSSYKSLMVALCPIYSMPFLCSPVLAAGSGLFVSLMVAHCRTPILSLLVTHAHLS